MERIWRGGCGEDVERDVWRGCGEGCVERIWRGGCGEDVERCGEDVERDVWRGCGEGGVEKVGRGCGEGGGGFWMGYKQVQVALFTHVRLISSIFQGRLLRAISC